MRRERPPWWLWPFVAAFAVAVLAGRCWQPAPVPAVEPTATPTMLPVVVATATPPAVTMSPARPHWTATPAVYVVDPVLTTRVPTPTEQPRATDTPAPTETPRATRAAVQRG